MPVRRVSGKPAKIPRIHQPSQPVPLKTDLGAFRPISAFFPSPTIQPLTIPDSFFDLPSQNKFKTPRSVPSLLDELPDDGPRGIRDSKNDPALNSQTLEPLHLGPDPTQVSLAPTPGSNVLGLQSTQTPLPSSLLYNVPVHSPSKVQKRGFFSKLFRFGKPQSEASKGRWPTKWLSKSRTSARPASLALASPAASHIPDPTTGPISIPILYSPQPLSAAALNLRNFSTQPTAFVMSDTTPESSTIEGVTVETTSVIQHSPAMGPEPVLQQISSVEPTFKDQQDALFRSTSPRHHAVLVKKPRTIQVNRYSRQSSGLTRPGWAPPHQFLDHARYTTYPQTTYRRGRPNLDFILDPRIAPDAADDAIRDPDRFYGIDHTQRAATNYTHHVGTGKYRRQPTGYTYGDYSRIQNPGYLSPVITPSYALCAVCNANPRYINPRTGMASPYCSDFCQAATAIATSYTQQATCSYPGCTRPAVMYPGDHHWNYCSESHEHLAREGCIYCRQADENGTQLCKRCNEALKPCTPTLIPVPEDHDAFWNVVDRFTMSWARPTQCPVVQAVYKVVSAPQSSNTYLAYRDTLEYYGQFAAQGKLSGNERVVWHGTRRACSLGETGRTTPCMIPRCSLCSIIRGSLDPDRSTPILPPGSGRLGTGIYTSTKSSRANDYSGNDKGISTPWKALLLNDVAAGYECVMRYDDPTLTAPPEGYDSVYGEVGGGLCYDELVVYSNEAIRPTWLVMYKQR